MNCHIANPIQNEDICAPNTFILRNDELIKVQKTFSKQDYPSLPTDMVKISGKDGNNIYLPLSKFEKALKSN